MEWLGQRDSIVFMSSDIYHKHIIQKSYHTSNVKEWLFPSSWKSLALSTAWSLETLIISARSIRPFAKQLALKRILEIIPSHPIFWTRKVRTPREGKCLPRVSGTQWSGSWALVGSDGEGPVGKALTGKLPLHQAQDQSRAGWSTSR